MSLVKTLSRSPWDFSRLTSGFVLVWDDLRVSFRPVRSYLGPRKG